MAADAGKNKVLRIGIIKDGKIAEERLIKASETVTVGESAKNTFVFGKTHLPEAEFAIFKWDGSAYVLRFTEKMKGKISAGGAVASLVKLRKEPSIAQSGGVWELKLTPQDRGKVTVDGMTVLFQFVAPPPVQAVKQLQQMNFSPRWIEDDDPLFFGSLAIWTALAGMMVLLVWNTEPGEFELEELPDRFTKMVIPKADVKPKVEPEDKPDEDELSDQATQTKAKKAEKAKKAAPPKDATEQAQRQEDLKKEVLQNSKLLVKLIGTTGENSMGVVSDVFGQDGMDTKELDSALASAGGVDIGGGPGVRKGEGVEGEAADIGGLAGAGGGSAEIGSGPAVTLKPQVSVGSGSMDDDIGNKDGVKGVIKRYAGQLKYCYERRLRQVPDLEGRVELGWSVFDGAVEGVYVVSNSTGDSELADCMMKKVRAWSFPSDVEGDVSWPFVFLAQE